MAWEKGRRSANNGACLEFNPIYGASGELEEVRLRDSKVAGIEGNEPPVIVFSAAEWDSFSNQVLTSPEKAAQLVMGQTVSIELPGKRTLDQIEIEPGWVAWVKSDQPDVVQMYSADLSHERAITEVGAAVLGLIEGDLDFRSTQEPQSIAA